MTGGSNAYEDFYCPTIEWDWGDWHAVGIDNRLRALSEPGKPEIKRRFTVEHVQGGQPQSDVPVKRNNKPLTAATVQIQVQPGLRDGGCGPDCAAETE